MRAQLFRGQHPDGQRQRLQSDFRLVSRRHPGLQCDAHHSFRPVQPHPLCGIRHPCSPDPLAGDHPAGGHPGINGPELRGPAGGAAGRLRPPGRRGRALHLRNELPGERVGYRRVLHCRHLPSARCRLHNDHKLLPWPRPERQPCGQWHRNGCVFRQQRHRWGLVPEPQCHLGKYCRHSCSGSAEPHPG